MKNLKRIIFEVVIIVSVFAAINVGYSKSKGSHGHVDQAGVAVPWLGFSPVMGEQVDIQTAGELLKSWKKTKVDVRGKIPVLGYDKEAMRLLPLDIPAGKLKHQYDPRFVGYVSQALLRDAVVSSTNELEIRVRKLENTVNRILANCCPGTKGK